MSDATKEKKGKSMTKNYESSQTYRESKPTAQRQDGSYSSFSPDDEYWDPTAPRKEQRYASPNFAEAENYEVDYGASAFSTGHNPHPAEHPDMPNQQFGALDAQALSDIAGTATKSFKGKAPKSTRLSRSEKKAAQRELQRKRREAQQRDKAIKKKRSSIKAQLKNRDKELSSITKTARKKRSSAKDVLHYIGYNSMYVDGVCEVEEGLFSETIAFEDTSYQSTRDDIQKGIFSSMCRLYDQFGADTLVQMSVINTPIPSSEIGSRQFFDPMKQDSANASEDAALFNEILNQKLRQGVSNIRRDRYITFSVLADNVEEAMPKLARIETETQRILSTVNSSSRVLNGTERLKVISSQLNPMKPFLFDYQKDVGIHSGMTTKDAIAPGCLDFKPEGYTDCFKSDGMWCQVLSMKHFGSELSDRALSDIVSLPIPLNATWFAQPIDKAKAIAYVRQRSAWIDKEIIDEQRSAVNKGYDYSILPYELKYSKEETEDMLDHLQNKNQRMYIFTGLFYTYASTKEELDNQALKIISTARQHSMEVDLLDFRQPEGLNSILPLGHNHINQSRRFTTAQTAILMPFATQELNDEGGTYYGQNQQSSNLVLCDRKKLTSPVAFVCGKTGSGKGMFVKQEMTGTILKNPTDEIFVIDRAGEYTEIVRRYGGNVFDFAVNSGTYLNPLDTTTNDHMSKIEQVAFKVDAVLAQAGASAAEAGNNLSEAEQSIIQRCVEEAFRQAELRGDGQPPLLQDFYDILKKQPEPDAQIIALRYERFVKGSMSFFNHHSNVDFDNRIIDFNLKELPDNMLVFALINVCEAVRNRMYQNADRNVRTWLYVEEMQSMFAYPTVLRYFSRFANEGRKFGMLLTGITQNASAMLANEAARNIVTNADFLMLLKQSALDRKEWIRLLNLSDQEEEFIDESCEPGNGLLIAGPARVPIRGKFPKGNKLYDLFSTNPNDIAERKAREKMFGE